MSAFPGLSLEEANRITFAQGSALLDRARLRQLERDEERASMLIAKLSQALSGKVEQIVRRPEPQFAGPPRQLTEEDMKTLAPFMAKDQ